MNSRRIAGTAESTSASRGHTSADLPTDDRRAIPFPLQAVTVDPADAGASIVPNVSIWDLIRSDYAATRDIDPTRPPGLNRTLDVLTQAGLMSLALFRLTHEVHRRGHRVLARLLLHVNLFLFNCEIQPQATIGPGATIAHPLGVAIGAGTIIGRGVRIHGLVRIGTGGYDGSKPDGFPVVGDDCRLFDHCMLFGPISVGARSRIGANVLLLESVPADSIVVAARGTVLDRRSHPH